MYGQFEGIQSGDQRSQGEQGWSGVKRGERGARQVARHHTFAWGFIMLIERARTGKEGGSE